MKKQNRAKRHTISFYNAGSGLWYAIRSQPNLKIHLLIGSLVLIAGIWLGITKVEWVILIFTIMWVIISEMINTSIESMVDLISEEYHVQAKVAKDVAAGVVLVGAIGSVVVGVMIFVPYLIGV